ncbi:MAG: hypothetical protein AAB668_04485 [Patescibacteria group bacterium]
MNKDTIQNIFIGILLGGVLLLAGGVYFLAMQVQTATRGIQRIEQSVTGSMEQMNNAFRCADSGGQYEDGQCKCGENYNLENGSCTGMDGLTKKQLEAIKVNQETIIMINEGFHCTDSGGQYTAGQCECGENYSLQNGSCMGIDGLTKKQLEDIKANQERLMQSQE